MKDIAEEARTLYNSLRITFQQVSDQRSEDEIALEKYRNAVSVYTGGEFDYWPSDKNLDTQLNQLSLPYSVSSSGLPETEEDAEKAQAYIIEEPTKAAIDHLIVERASDKDMDVQKHLEG